MTHICGFALAQCLSEKRVSAQAPNSPGRLGPMSTSHSTECSPQLVWSLFGPLEEKTAVVAVLSWSSCMVFQGLGPGRNWCLVWHSISHFMAPGGSTTLSLRNSVWFSRQIHTECTGRWVRMKLRSPSPIGIQGDHRCPVSPKIFSKSSSFQAIVSKFWAQCPPPWPKSLIRPRRPTVFPSPVFISVFRPVNTLMKKKVLQGTKIDSRDWNSNAFICTNF